MGRAARGSSVLEREQVAGKPAQGAGRAQGVQCSQSIVRLDRASLSQCLWGPGTQALSRDAGSWWRHSLSRGCDAVIK